MGFSALILILNEVKICKSSSDPHSSSQSPHISSQLAGVTNPPPPGAGTSPLWVRILSGWLLQGVLSLIRGILLPLGPENKNLIDFISCNVSQTFLPGLLAKTSFSSFILYLFWNVKQFISYYWKTREILSFMQIKCN